MNNENTNVESLILTSIAALFTITSVLVNVPVAIFLTSLLCAVLGFMLIKKRWAIIAKIPKHIGYTFVFIELALLIAFAVWAW